MKPVQTFPSYSFQSNLNITLTSTPRSYRWQQSLHFPTKILCTALLSPVRAKCLPHHIVLDLTITTLATRITNHEAPQYEMSFILRSLCASQIQLFSAASCSQILWSSTMFLNHWATARYWALASIIPGRERFSQN